MPLTLTRNAGQSLRIGRAIVTVSKITGRRVVLVTDAPQSVQIARGELPIADAEAVGLPTRQAVEDLGPEALGGSVKSKRPRMLTPRVTIALDVALTKDALALGISKDELVRRKLLQPLVA